MDFKFPFNIEQLNEKQVEELAKNASQYALANGILLCSPSGLTVHVPFMLFPSPFPRKLFHQAKEVQEDFNLLLHKVSQDHDFLKESLQGTIAADDFIARIFNIYEQTKNEGIAQLPSNSALIIGIAEAIAQAWEMYGNERAVILMVARNVDSGMFDQRHVEYHLHRRSPRIKMITRSLLEMHERAKLDDNKKLIIDGCEVAVVYYRSGYTPHDYPTEGVWATRLLVERSLAIKCPTAALHLLTTKKMQQVLAKPGVLERFISDEGSLQRIRKTFTGLYTLDEGLEGDQNVKMALQDPRKYVLKPQREGGGNNFYGDDVKTTLNKMKNPLERSQYILMDKIRPPSFKNYIISSGLDKPVLTDVISELGIYGVLISNGDKLLINKQVGHLLRTKSDKTEDGGAMSGRACFDSPYLV